MQEKRQSTGAPSDSRKHSGGWIEAACFAVALAVLNVTYGIGQQLGVNPIALLVWAMPVGAIALLAVSGLGPDWRRIMTHPLSLVVGGAIIAMEGVYYVLIGHVTPTDGSVLVRIGVPIAMLLAFLVTSRRPSRLGILGATVIAAVILWYTPQMRSEAPLTALSLGVVCGFIIGSRSLAAEHHPWNRAAHTILEKMRVTGLVLLFASGLGIALMCAAIMAADHGILAQPVWLPRWSDLVHPPAIWLGLFLGVVVLTVMQYLSFSIVVKLGAETFVATTAFIPFTTLAVQFLAVAAGLMAPVPVDWRVMPAMLGLLVGVTFVILGTRPRPP